MEHLGWGVVWEYWAGLGSLVGGVLPGVPRTTPPSGIAARAVGPSLELKEGVQSGLLF